MQDQKGFTLIEVVIAISIFAVLGFGCYKVVNGLALARDTMTKNAEELRRFSRAINTINMDFSQLSARKILDESGQDIASFDTHGDYLVEFSRIGVKNPLMVKRAKVARVAYQFKDTLDSSDLKLFKDNTQMLDFIGDGKKGYLVRYVWPVLDRGNDDEPSMQIILANIKGVEMEYLDDKKIWVDEWPQPGGQAAASLTNLPYAVKIKIETDKYGVLERLFAVRQLPVAE